MFTAGLESGFEQVGQLPKSVAQLRQGTICWVIRTGWPRFWHKARKLTRFRIPIDQRHGGELVQRVGPHNGNSLLKSAMVIAGGHRMIMSPMRSHSVPNGRSRVEKTIGNEIEPGAHLACDVLSLNEIEAREEPYAISTKSNSAIFPNFI